MSLPRTRIQTALLSFTSSLTSLVLICFCANFRISFTALGALFLKVTLCSRLCRWMVNSRVTAPRTALFLSTMILEALCNLRSSAPEVLQQKRRPMLDASFRLYPSHTLCSRDSFAFNCHQIVAIPIQLSDPSTCSGTSFSERSEHSLVVQLRFLIGEFPPASSPSFDKQEGHRFASSVKLCRHREACQSTYQTFFRSLGEPQTCRAL